MKVEREQFWQSLRRVDLEGTVLHVFGEIGASETTRNQQCEGIEQLLMSSARAHHWCRVGLASYGALYSGTLDEALLEFATLPDGVRMGLARVTSGSQMERFSLLEIGSLEEARNSESLRFLLDGERVVVMSTVAKRGSESRLTS